MVSHPLSSKRIALTFNSCIILILLYKYLLELAFLCFLSLSLPFTSLPFFRIVHFTFFPYKVTPSHLLFFSLFFLSISFPFHFFISIIFLERVQ